MEYQLNVIWPVDPFTADNGATPLWPARHRDDAVDPFAIAPIADEMAPGSALLFLGTVHHVSGAKLSRAVQPTSIVGSCLGCLRTSEQKIIINLPQVARQLSTHLTQRVFLHT